MHYNYSNSFLLNVSIQQLFLTLSLSHPHFWTPLYHEFYPKTNVRLFSLFMVLQEFIFNRSHHNQIETAIFDSNFLTLQMLKNQQIKRWIWSQEMSSNNWIDVETLDIYGGLFVSGGSVCNLRFGIADINQSVEKWTWEMNINLPKTPII